MLVIPALFIQVQVPLAVRSGAGFPPLLVQMGFPSLSNHLPHTQSSTVNVSIYEVCEFVRPLICFSTLAVNVIAVPPIFVHVCMNTALYT